MNKKSALAEKQFSRFNCAQQANKPENNLEYIQVSGGCGRKELKYFKIIIMKCNVGPIDRMIRIIIGLVIAIVGV
ncbi:MAG: YgaP family membrane protein, partial [Mariniphaga sp.]